jgi:parvulin-like peptidyl-prolyl isomerase
LANDGTRPREVASASAKTSVAPGDVTPQIAFLPDSDPPSVPRLQKPEQEPPKRPAKGPILDLASSSAAVPDNSEVAARIRATVNGVAILDDEVREAIYPYLLATQNLPEPERTQKRKEIFEKELQHLIEREVVLQDMFTRLGKQQQFLEKIQAYADKDFEKKMREQKNAIKIKTDEEFKAYLRSQGLSLAGVKRQVERNFMFMEYMRERIRPVFERICHEQVLEFYQQHPEEFQVPDSVTWQDIFIDAGKFPNRDAARQFAQRLAANARAGQDFQKMVTQYDQGDSSYRNGEGYGHRRGEIKPPEAESILFNLRDGDIGPVVELTNGFHVIRLVKRQYAGLKPFDEKTQATIRNKLQGEASEREYKRILAELKRKASIEVSATAP